MNSNNHHDQDRPADPLDLALAAIDEFDHYVNNHEVESVAWKLAARAELRTAFAQAAELRSIRNLLVMVAQTMSDALEADSDAA